MYLSYIYLADGLCYMTLAYPKETYIILKVNMCRTCYIILLSQNLLHPSMIYNHMAMTMTILCDMWPMCDSDIMLNPNPNKNKSNRK